MSYEDQVATIRKDVDGLIRAMAELRGQLRDYRNWAGDRFILVDNTINDLTAIPAIEATTLAGWEPGPARVVILYDDSTFTLEPAVNAKITDIEAEGCTVDDVKWGHASDDERGSRFSALIVYRLKPTDQATDEPMP